MHLIVLCSQEFVTVLYTLWFCITLIRIILPIAIHNSNRYNPPPKRPPQSTTCSALVSAQVPYNVAFKNKTSEDVQLLVVDSIVDVIFFIDIGKKRPH